MLSKRRTDGSYHYFNDDGSYYHKPAPDQNELYVSPEVDHRYYYPSPAQRKSDAFFLGTFWKTHESRACWIQKNGNIVLTPKNRIDEKVLWKMPQKYIGVFMNKQGAQRLVEVDKSGFFIGSEEWEMREIEYWLQNLVPVRDLNGPKLTHCEAWCEAQRAASLPSQRLRFIPKRYIPWDDEPELSVPEVKDEDRDGILRRQGKVDLGAPTFDVNDNHARASSHVVIKEEVKEEDMGQLKMEEQNGHSIHVKEEEEPIHDERTDLLEGDTHLDQMCENNSQESSMDERSVVDQADSDDLDDCPAMTGSNWACSHDLARRSQAVQGSRIRKSTTARKAVRGTTKPLRNEAMFQQVTKRISEGPK